MVKQIKLKKKGIEELQEPVRRSSKFRFSLGPGSTIAIRRVN